MYKLCIYELISMHTMHCTAMIPLGNVVNYYYIIWDILGQILFFM